MIKTHVQVCLLGVCLLVGVTSQAQTEDDTQYQLDTLRPVPILTGAAAWFTQVNAGKANDQPWIIPALLVPVGDKWLVEGRFSYWPVFARGSNGQYTTIGNFYDLDYGTVDYVANRYLTLVAGQFLTPFGMYNERLAPYWIRALQGTPLASSISSNTGLGGEARGAFPVGTQNVSLNYAFYFSANNTNHFWASTRATGSRIGFFFPKHRLEIGTSFQQLLESDHSHIVGLHAEWQPNRLPLTLRSEFVRSSGLNGSGYWIESVYRLSQVPYLRRLELAGRGQQFFALGRDTNQGDFGLNYYLGRDVRASASYGRQFAFDKDANLWLMAITYRFIMPLGPTGSVR